MRVYRGKPPSSKIPAPRGFPVIAVPVPPVPVLEPLAPLDFRMATDEYGDFMEVGFQSAAALEGTAATGWLDPTNRLVLDLQRSADLLTWTLGDFTDCAGSPADNGDGTYDYWARANLPATWNSIMLDWSLSCSRYQKNLTGMTCGGEAVALAGFPYEMPAEKTRLLSDLAAAGFTGASVKSVPVPLSVQITNYTADGMIPLLATVTDDQVTAVTRYGTVIPLAGYPYRMPARRAELQAALRAAGQSGAVVRLYGSLWTVYLPDRVTPTLLRDFVFTLTPGDPYPKWDSYGTYLGIFPDDAAWGGFSNPRNPQGALLKEASSQFARLRITPQPTP